MSAILKCHFRAKDSRQPRALGRRLKTDGTGKTVVVGERESLQIHFLRSFDQGFWGRCAIEEGKIGVTMEFSIGRCISHTRELSATPG